MLDCFLEISIIGALLNLDNDHEMIFLYLIQVHEYGHMAQITLQHLMVEVFQWNSVVSQMQINFS